MSRRYNPKIVASDDYKFEWFGNNRTLCDVLADMRKCQDTHNYSPLAGLIEEAQVMGNRIEAALNDQKDLLSITKELAKARKAYKRLEAEFTELLSQVNSLKRPKTDNKS